ncbi:MAG: nucleoside-diphosphate sugar epimerase/dehydratase [Alphaproteobacteria bacterium]
MVTPQVTQSSDKRSPHDRRIFKFAHDLFAMGMAFILALMLRSGLDFFKLPPAAIGKGLALILGLSAVVFGWRGLHRSVWRYTSLPDLSRIAIAVTVVIALYAIIQTVWTGFQGLPRSSVPIAWGAGIFLLGSSRLAWRMYHDRYLLERSSYPRLPVLLLGIDDGAEPFVRETTRRADSPYRPIGILAADRNAMGAKIHGVEILGTYADLGPVLRRLRIRGTRPQHLIVASATLSGKALEPLMSVAEAEGLSWSRLPRITELAREKKSAGLEIQPIAIDDLLQRPAAELDRAAMLQLVMGRRVLVTGAGGSIGGELVRQIAAMKPAQLTVVDNGEYALYTIDRELEENHSDLNRKSILADVRDAIRVTAIIAAERPELVFHAAALKHVPMVEAHPIEGIRTNVLGTRNVAEACRQNGVSCMVLISTDKVVDPTNVMGATKRLAECIAQAFDIETQTRPGNGGTRFVTVRFGNVLGSSGSVVPLFRRQLERGGPLTVTHPEVTRYFMTIREAVELVLQASALGASDITAAGKIFVLDMGEPVKIIDLARRMIQLAGLRPEKDVRIIYTGLRPGEKLSEALLHDSESLLPTKARGVLLAAPRYVDPQVLARALDELTKLCSTTDADRVVKFVQQLVPEYRPAENAAVKARQA